MLFLYYCIFYSVHFLISPFRSRMLISSLITSINCCILLIHHSASLSFCLLPLDLRPNIFAVAYLALREKACEIFGKRNSNKMITFLSMVYFYGTKNYQSIFFFLNSVSNIQYTINIYILNLSSFCINVKYI